MKKHVLKIFNKKKATLMLLAFIGFGSFQMNGQTALTVTDAVEVQNFTVKNGGDLDDPIIAITAGTGSPVDNNNFLGIVSDAIGSEEPYTSSDDVQATFTFTVRSTAVDVTSDITLSFRKRKGNSVAGTVDIEGTEVQTFSAASDGATNQALEDIADVVLTNVTLTTSPKTIVVNLNSLLRGSQITSHAPTFRFDGVSINKTAVAGGTCTETDITDLVADAGAEHVSLAWSDATCFDEVLVVAKESSAVTVTPIGDGTAYSANADFDSGTDLGTSEYAVYKGTANNLIVTGLTKGGTTYHFEVFTRKGTDWSAGAVVSATTNNTYTSISGGNNDGLNWGDASSWIGGAVPSATSDNVIINAGLIINSDVELNDIVIESRLTITEGFSIKANDIEQNSQFIISSSSSAFGSVIANSFSGTNNLIYDRWLNDSPKNDLISSPVSGVLFSSVSTNSQNENRFFINPSDPTNYLFGPFDNTDGTYKTYSTGAGANDATVIVSGKGYRAATIAGEANTVRFTGAVETGSVPVTITDGGDATYGEWNLIGNPFPSYLDFDTFFSTNTSQFEAGANNAIYGWDADAAGTGGKWTIWNALTGAGKKIAPGQGFFVKTKDATTGTVTFAPEMRTNGNADDFIAGRSANNVKQALAKINLSSATNTYATDIYFVDNQTKGLDTGYDAGAFAGSADGIYTNLVEDNTGVEIAIQALPYDDFKNVVVPVAIKSNSGVELTIGLDVASLTIPSNIYVYLKDNLLNTTTLLNDEDYVFTPSTALSGAGRFFIEFSSKSILSTENYASNDMLIYADQASKSIIIKGILKADVSAKVYDIQGRVVLEQKLDSSNITNVVNTNALKTGVYIVGLEGNTQKIIIK